MNTFFFSPHKNFIKHSLAHADDTLTPKHEILSAGTEVTLLDTGVLKFEPSGASSQSIVISCAIHGDETAPVEIISNIIDGLLAEDIKCSQRVLFVLGNPWAAIQGKRFVDINMNRLFCNAWQHQDLKLKEVKRAAKLEAYTANFFAEEPVTVTNHLHYDCHTAIRASEHNRFAVYPFVEGRIMPAAQSDFLHDAEIQAVVFASEPSNTYSAFTANHYHAESFTLELGKAKPFGENNLRDFSAIERAITRVIEGEPHPVIDSATLKQYSACHSIIRQSEPWQFLVGDEVANFTALAPGTPVYQQAELTYTVGDEPEYILFPNANVPVGHRAGLLLHRR